MTPVTTYQNYDEDGRPDDGGCFTETVIEWQCADRDACRNNRRENWKLAQQIAHGDDLAARESGYGQIH
jgi:hypothetical protein